MNPRLLRLAGALALASCAAAPPAPGTVVSAGAFESAIVPGRTTRADLRATLGPTKAVRFDSGYEAWLYVAPAGQQQFTELVILLGPDGVVKKTRRRDP